LSYEDSAFRTAYRPHQTGLASAEDFRRLRLPAPPRKSRPLLTLLALAVWA